jgi:hypothetical protein
MREGAVGGRGGIGRDEQRLDSDMRDALRVVAGPPAANEIDWWTLRRTIVGDAAPYLEGTWRRRRWWEYAAGWIRPAVPVGVAVSIIAMVMAGSAGSVANTALASVAATATDTTDGSLWLHAVRGGAAASDADPLLGESRIAALVGDAQASTVK